MATNFHEESPMGARPMLCSAQSASALLGAALALAVACGSLSTRAAGGTEAQPTMEEALEAMETSG